jgi:hypothetical protein
MDEQTKKARKREGAPVGAGPTKRGPRPSLPISMELQAEIADVARMAGVDVKAVAAQLSAHVERELKRGVARIYAGALSAALGLSDPVA